jgi:SpoVK/Ycf46/Vps4 family AAA+-type ATPase
MKISEIEQLKSALIDSPNNEFIRDLLINKIIEEGSVNNDYETLLKDSIQMIPSKNMYREKLIEYYFKQSKFSVCIMIYENIPFQENLNNKTKSMIVESFLGISDFEKAQRLYFEFLELDPEFKNEKLDAHFKVMLPNTNKETNNQSYQQEELFLKSNINFSHIGGQETIKELISIKIIKPLQNIDLFKKYGKKTGGGILFFGPPGCGKTFIARATAGEIESNFLSIGINEILDAYLGNSEKNVHSFFNKARENSPCVLFIDEIDALGADRESFSSNVGRGVVNQLLTEMDGVKFDNDGLLVIGASNTPWQIDSALMRPGRFSNVIFVPPPDFEGRIAILKLKLKERPIDKLNYAKISKRLKHFSGADIDALIDLVIEKILDYAIRTGVERNVTTNDFLDAIPSIRPSTIAWFTNVLNYVEYGNKTGLYDDVAKYLRKNPL